jgi:hypothetical protein
VLALRRFTRYIEAQRARNHSTRDGALLRAAEDRPLDADPYSDTIIDLARSARCSRNRSRQGVVRYLAADFRRPGSSRLHGPDLASQGGMEANVPTAVERQDRRVTPLENPQVNGP